MEIDGKKFLIIYSTNRNLFRLHLSGIYGPLLTMLMCVSVIFGYRPMFLNLNINEFNAIYSFGILE
jgi:hypothetical protein